jgi:hypothetical protein
MVDSLRDRPVGQTRSHQYNRQEIEFTVKNMAVVKALMGEVMHEPISPLTSRVVMPVYFSINAAKLAGRGARSQIVE